MPSKTVHVASNRILNFAVATNFNLYSMLVVVAIAVKIIFVPANIAATTIAVATAVVAAAAAMVPRTSEDESWSMTMVSLASKN